MDKNIHLDPIDKLRGVAILMVIISHCFGYAGSIPAFPPATEDFTDIRKFSEFLFHRTIANGFWGVMIFFVLSGFCIRWSHLNAARFTWKDFYRRRFFRIVPAYWFWLSIGCMFATVSLGDFLLHALLLHNLQADTYLSIIGPLWSIAIEWQIYLLYPLILYITSKFSKRSVLASFALANLGSSLLASNSAAELIGSDALRILGRLPTALMFAWMLGFYMADSVHNGNLARHSPLPLVLSILAGILTHLHPNTVFLSSVPWSLAAYFLVALIVSKQSQGSPGRLSPLAWVGIVSYSVYLSHDLFVKVYPHAERFFDIARGSFSGGAAAFLSLSIPMLLVGLISHRFIELQGIRLGKSTHFRPKSAVTGS